MQYSIGIDIGGTHTAFGIVDKQGLIVFQDKVLTREQESIDILIDAIYEKLQAPIANLGVSTIKGIGVGAPNGNFYNGTIEFAPNLPWKGIIPLAQLFQQKFDLHTIVTNDANAAAIGEMMYGAAKGMKDFMMVTLGTGVGSGFVANGKMIYGHDGFAGELGHVIAVREGRPCGCGRKGCLETYASATGIVRTANEYLQHSEAPSLLRQQEEISAKSIYEAAQAGDEMALAIFDVTGKILGQSLADAVAITSPQAIILFGGLAQAGSFLFGPTKQYFEDNLLIIYKNKIDILPSELKESDVAILGAAALVWS
jgi:glucokinase